MLDLKLIRENPDLVREKLNSRNGSYDLQPLLQLDEQRRSLEQARSQLQARGNEIGKLVGQKMKAGGADAAEIQSLKDEATR